MSIGTSGCHLKQFERRWVKVFNTLLRKFEYGRGLKKIMRKENKFLRSILICMMMFISMVSAWSQEKHTEHYNQVWLAYFNQTRFSDKWGLWTDIHLRTKEDFCTNFSQSILRFGLTYYLHDATKLQVRYAYGSN